MHIYVCGHEKKTLALLESLGIENNEILVPYSSSCRFNNENGCILGDTKPFQCRLYPLLFLYDGYLGIDPACTYSGEYLSQLTDPLSDARSHFDAMKKEASLLTKAEKLALADWSHYVCDVVTLKKNKKNSSISEVGF